MRRCSAFCHDGAMMKRVKRMKRSTEGAPNWRMLASAWERWKFCSCVYSMKARVTWSLNFAQR